MYKYVLRRVFLAVPVLLLSSLIVFGLMRVMPGDALTSTRPRTRSGRSIAKCRESRPPIEYPT